MANPEQGDSWWDQDSDNDNASNADEVAFGSDPYSLDGDFDGLGDYVEFFYSQTDPWLWDSDGDGYSDFDEYYQQIQGYTPVINYAALQAGTYYSYSDADGDGIKNFEDSDPQNNDRDGDGVLNWNEPAGLMDDPGVIIGGNQYATGTLDSDNDGTPDQLDPFPYGSFTYQGTEYGGSWSDRDNDEIPDPADSFPDGSYWYEGVEYAAPFVDQDGDAIPDVADQWPTIAWGYVYNGVIYPGNWSDMDNDGIPDPADPIFSGTGNSYWWQGVEYAGPWMDADSDGIPDAFDPFPQIAGSFWYQQVEYPGWWSDRDTDGVPDAADSWPDDGWNGAPHYNYLGNEYSGYSSDDRDSDGIPDSADVYPDDPTNHADSDGDGLCDYDENTQYHTDPAKRDTDDDGLSDSDELFTTHTDPLQARTNPNQIYNDYQLADQTDTDSDGIPDRVELFYASQSYGMNPNDPADAGGDLDGDGYTNIQAWRNGWSLVASINSYDYDHDGIFDVLEDAWNAVYPGILSNSTAADAVLDFDGDGLMNFEEIALGLNPGSPNSRSASIHDSQEWVWRGLLGGNTGGVSFHGARFVGGLATESRVMEDGNADGVPDGLMNFVSFLSSNPSLLTMPQRMASGDYDGDGMPDCWEHRFNFDLRNAANVVSDPDGDGLTNLAEWRFKSNPLVRATNLDDVSDSKRLYEKTHATTTGGGGLMSRYRAQIAQDLGASTNLKNFNLQQGGGGDLPEYLNPPIFSIHAEELKVTLNDSGDVQSTVLTGSSRDGILPNRLSATSPSGGGGGDPGEGTHLCDYQDCHYCEGGYNTCPDCKGNKYLACPGHETSCTPTMIVGTCQGHTAQCPGDHIYSCPVIQHYASTLSTVCGITYDHTHSQEAGCYETFTDQEGNISYGDLICTLHVHEDSCNGYKPLSHLEYGCGHGLPCNCAKYGCSGIISIDCPGPNICPYLTEQTCTICNGTGTKTIPCFYNPLSSCPNRPPCTTCNATGQVPCTNSDCEQGHLKQCACNVNGCECYGLNTATDSGRCPNNHIGEGGGQGARTYTTEKGTVTVAYFPGGDQRSYQLLLNGVPGGEFSPDTQSMYIDAPGAGGTIDVTVEVIEDVEDVEMAKPGEVGFHDSAGSRYRKIGLNGLPIPDSKPQVQDESGERSEETYIDAFTRQLRHSVSDIYANAEGSLLPLAVRRDVSSEIWTLHTGLRPEEKPNLPFGPGWTSNLCSHVKFETQMDTSLPGGADAQSVADWLLNSSSQKHIATVVDEQGGSMSYVLKSPGLWIHSGEEQLDAKTAKNTFDGTMLVKKFGTKCFYEDAGIQQIMPASRVGGSNIMMHVHYSRLLEVWDREGNRLRYEYAGPGTLIPERIYDPERPGRCIQILQENGRVVAVRGPDGHTVNYNYAGLCLDSVERGGTSVHYGYQQTWEAAANGNTDLNHRTNHIDVQSITDELNRQYVFIRDFDHSRLLTHYTLHPMPGLPRVLTGVTTPAGTMQLTASWAGNRSMVLGGDNVYADSSIRTCTALDGTVTTYNFGNPHVYDARQVHAMDIKTANAVTVTYLSLAITQSKNGQSFGTETYTCDPTAGYALASATDRSGHTTTFTYGQDGYDDPLTETDALGNEPDAQGNTDPQGHTKTFTYDPATRVMTSMTDALGTTTEYTLAPSSTITRDGVDITVQGLKTAEITTGADGNRRETHYSYDHPVFAGLVTSQTTVSPNEAAMPSSVTTTTLGAQTDAQGANTGWWAETTQTTTSAAGGDALMSSTTVHDLSGNKRSVIDGRNLVTNFAYDEHLRLIRVTHPDLSEKHLAYDDHGNLISETNENGVTVNHHYDNLNRRRKTKLHLSDGTDIVTTTHYNLRNQVVCQSDARGKVTRHTYDDAGRLVTTDDGGFATQFYYDGNNGGTVFDTSGIKPNRTTDPRGTVTAVEYDALYRPTTHTVTATGISAVSTTTYDALGHPITVTDPLGRVTTNAYNGLGELVQVTHPDGSTVHTTYTHHGKPWQVTDENGKTTTTTYDAAGRPVMVQAPEVDGGVATHTTEYDAASNVIRVTDALGRETETEYDVRNRPIAVYAPTVWDAQAIQFVRPTSTTTYDALGQVLTVTDPQGHVTSKFYDEAGRNWKVVAPVLAPNTAGPTTTTTFDAGGLPLTVTNPLGQTMTNTYDTHGRLIMTVDAAGITNSFDYDAAGNRTSVVDGKGQTTTFVYDGLNRLVSQTFANGDTTSYTYNAVQKLSQKSPRNITTSYTYDERDRVTATSAPGLNRSYSYDSAGHLLGVTEAENDAANVSYTYDALGHVLTETSCGVQHSYSYDLAGNRVRADYGTGRSVQTSYDALNRPESVVEGDRATRYGYDLGGRAILLMTGNGQVTRNSYDALGRLTNRTLYRTLAMSTGDVMAQFAWQHDLLGNVTSQSETWPGEPTRSGVRTTGMTYDANNRLATETITDPTSAETSTAYTYDNANNRVHKQVTGGTDPGMWNYSYNSANQLTSWEQLDGPAGNTRKSAVLAYDGSGNRISQNVTDFTGASDTGLNPPTAAGGLTTYQWDAQDRLSSVTLPNGQTHAYDYDYRTRRIATHKIVASVQQEMTAIVFAGGLSLAEFQTGSNTLPATPTVEYTRGPDMGGGVGGMLYSIRSGVPKYSLSNGRGDIVAQADSSATLTWTASYEAYGRRTAETGSNADKQRGNSKDEDPTGLLNEGFRYRDLETGVWLSRDPAGFVDGPNVYAYVKQNPWTSWDPEGLYEEGPQGIRYSINNNGYVHIIQCDVKNPVFKAAVEAESNRNNPAHYDRAMTRFAGLWHHYGMNKNPMYTVHEFLSDARNIEESCYRHELLAAGFSLRPFDRGGQFRYRGSPQIQVPYRADAKSASPGGASAQKTQQTMGMVPQQVQLQQAQAGRPPWPAGFRTTGGYSAAELLKANCVSDAAKIQNAIGGELLSITPQRSPQLGAVNLPNGERLTGWYMHQAVLKNGNVFDRITGPKGMPMDKYKQMYEHADAINFTPIRKK
ncbi:RHS repeat-associated core domain-containing protein [Prosthecobacter sp.]|uniref:RHS repeat-associated core domain-containing protein n=1 Tax=Prosthecobacter sp. TaxID=1965333 RepID=UPI0037830806